MCLFCGCGGTDSFQSAKVILPAEIKTLPAGARGDAADRSEEAKKGGGPKTRG